VLSGLSLGTLVVEATLRSGSLITARLAMEQGREVFAIPGSIHNPLARGCHQLIRQGAKLVETADDILEELGPLLRQTDFSLPEQSLDEQADDPKMDPEHLSLLQHVDFEPTAIDTIIARSGLTADVVSSMLLIMELNNLVAAETGGYYVRVG
jgi:DNA processing protein